MKTFRPKDYTNRVFDKLKDEHPNLTKKSIEKVIGIYFRNFRTLIFFRLHIHVDRYVKIQPFFKDTYLRIKKYRQNE